MHRQISPRSRISLFHFIYDKVGATSPVCRLADASCWCVRVGRTGAGGREEGGCPPRFGFRRGERELSFCRNKTRLSNQARPGIDGPATIIAVMERAHLSAGRSGAHRQRFPHCHWLFRGFLLHRGSSIFGSSYRAPQTASISLIALKCTRNPRLFSPTVDRLRIVDACARNSRSKLRVAVNDE